MYFQDRDRLSVTHPKNMKREVKEQVWTSIHQRAWSHRSWWKQVSQVRMTPRWAQQALHSPVLNDKLWGNTRYSSSLHSCHGTHYTSSWLCEIRSLLCQSHFSLESIPVRICHVLSFMLLHHGKWKLRPLFSRLREIYWIFCSDYTVEILICIQFSWMSYFLSWEKRRYFRKRDVLIS